MSKFPIIVTIITFLVLIASVANLAICFKDGTDIPIAIGIVVVMAGVTVANIVTLIKDKKRRADNEERGDDLDDDEDEDDE